MMQRRNPMSRFAKMGCFLLILMTAWGCSSESTDTRSSQLTPLSTLESTSITPSQLSPSPTLESIHIISSKSLSPPGLEKNSTATPSHPAPFCLSQNMNWLEQEHTVTCYSYWGLDVRKAEIKNLFTRINAAYLDLESGDTSENLADIYYRLSCGSTCTPLWSAIEGEGAIVVSFGDHLPTIEECVEILLEAKDRVVSPSLLLPGYGHYSCIQTREGRVGWIRYDDDFRLGLGQGRSQITYWIWDKFVSDAK